MFATVPFYICLQKKKKMKNEERNEQNFLIHKFSNNTTNVKPLANNPWNQWALGLISTFCYKVT